MHVTTPRVENLETRTLFASGAGLVEVLRVVGDRGSTNTIVVADSADGQSVEVDITSVNRAGVVSTFEESFAKSSGFTRVVIRGGRRDDVIVVGSEADPFEMNVTVNSHAGNDTINTGAGNDRVNAGVGNDIILTGAGNDVVHAAKGADQIFGGEGNDILWGGAGADHIEAGNGDDKMGGILGINEMFGGDGADEFVVRSLERNPTNDFTEGTDVLTVRVKREDPAPAAE